MYRSNWIVVCTRVGDYDRHRNEHERIQSVAFSSQLKTNLKLLFFSFAPSNHALIDRMKLGEKINPPPVRLLDRLPLRNSMRPIQLNPK